MNKKIVVIGAGASGVAATTKLLGAGFRNIVLLEAEDRIGGRVHTIPFGKNILDMGAQWCHGEKDNVVFELAKSKDVLSSNLFHYDVFSLYKSNGDAVPRNIAKKLIELAYRLVYEAESTGESITTSLGNYVLKRYYEELQAPEYNDVDELLRKQFIEFFHKFENSIEASESWFDTSAGSYPQYWICEGDPLLNWRDQGYKTLFELLQRKLSPGEEPLSIDGIAKLGKEVSKIRYSQPGSSFPVRIECSDGTAYEADHVISTMSLGVLKERHISLFNPLLPLEKIVTIEGLSLGTVDKIYLEFEQPFWPNDWEGCSFLWNYEELKTVREHTNNWLEDVFGFYKVDRQPNILCGWVCGPSARRMEQTTQEEVKAGVLWLLRMFLKDFNVPDPINIVTSNWYTNPHFRGSYTYYSMKSDALKATTTKLSKPIVDSNGIPVILFGGEATNEHYYSTVHGAVESGWREAKRIIDLYKLRAQL